MTASPEGPAPENATGNHAKKDYVSIDLAQISDFEIGILIIERDTCQFKMNAIDEILNKIGEVKGFADAEGKDAKKEPVAVKEETFTLLKFEPQTGAKIGTYGVAYESENLPDKWNHPFNILRQANATISSRYHGEGFVYSYWLYGQGKIYRQLLKRNHQPKKGGDSE